MQFFSQDIKYAGSADTETESYVRFWNVSPSLLQKSYLKLWKEINEFCDNMDNEKKPKKQIWDILSLLLFQQSDDGNLAMQSGEALILKVLDIDQVKIYINILSFIFKEESLRKV